MSPFFELKELHTDVVTPDNKPGKLFCFTYSTNQDEIQMKITAPDGSSTGPFTLSGPGERNGWARIPPKDVGSFGPNPANHFSDIEGAYIALPGTYKMTVYDKSGKTKIWDKELTFQGAKLVCEDARVTKWKWHWSWPVCLFFTKEIAITVSNKGDLPSCACVLLRFDALNDPDDYQIKWLELGFVAPGESRTFTVGDLLQSFTAKVNFKRVGDLIPPSTHALSVRLASDLPRPKFTGGFPQESRQYYISPECPYPIVTYEHGINLELKDDLLLLDDYSTTVQTPPVQTG